ncbi:cytochrome bc1 complex cytochrome b subunit [Microtetraspora sp. NBRC 13810]|uniref:cytochrome bc1 complex cytochrome b subunit n=1 Tax=Microtetraspora sp. NBRC 13810 TaxID=3030990 RepID=UPI0024A354BB|nr:ubiquinol-cytochrome c reductase cytochrome b subunit [Microtetraspora sp. NBRC 13810]GLW12327.1 cytochrome bc1 complex cytochrome b subunit [Microtetraspora sp. NBRC 13810]
MAAGEPEVPKAVARGSRFVDDRVGAAGFLKRNLRKVFPDHWTFLLGEIALYSFVILLLSGTFLTFWFKPGMGDVVYNGAYAPLRGVTMSEAYASALHISFEVRGGLLMRQIHHWAALLFVAAILVHMLRIFFTGAYRKPRELNWLIGLVLLTLALVEGLTGYSLPDDLLSGAGLRITQGVVLSIPVVGTYLSFLLFGGEYPGEDIISRFFTIHILLLPGLLVALITAHLILMWVQKHTQMPGKGHTETNVVGGPLYPSFMLKSGAFFFFTFGVLTALGGFAQINPIWLFGPYSPANVSAGSQPDFYLGFLDGALRMMPSWEINLWGHTLTLSVLIPALLPMFVILTGLAVYPFAERWITGDRREHHVADRPRNNPHRTAIGMAAITFYGVLWLLGANDEISANFHISLYATTWFSRIAVFVGPAVAYYVTYRICVGLQRKDAGLVRHGVESGVIKRLPHGEFIEVHAPSTEELADRVLAKEPIPVIEADGHDGDGVPPKELRGPIGHLRARLSHVYGGDKVPLPEEEHEEGRPPAELEQRGRRSRPRR